MSRVFTVKDLRAAIQDLPDGLAVEGYDGSDAERGVAVYMQDYDEVDETLNPVLVISTDWPAKGPLEWWTAKATAEIKEV